MGLMIPAALGAKLARPDVPMLGLGADGSLLMRLGELEVFARTGVAMRLAIINDQALGTMKSRQKSRGLPDYALDLHPGLNSPTSLPPAACSASRSTRRSNSRRL